jgi:asparagine synthase (glutamine-hydrolysing)
MFAFAVWDSTRRRLMLARDRVGVKPLYYAELPGRGIVFGSELKALLEDPDVPRDWRPEAIDAFLTLLYIPAPATIYKGVHKLEPGHILIAEKGSVRTSRYWDLQFTGEGDARREDEYLEQLDALLSEAVAAYMVETSSRPPVTISVGFDHARYDELAHARRVAEHLGCEFHPRTVTPDIVSLLPKLAWHFDEPFADSSAIPSFYVAQLSRQHVTVVLNGDGGDECFGGYQRYAAMARLGRFPYRALASLAPARLGAFVAARTRYRSLPYKVGRALELLPQTPARRYGLLMSYFGPELKLALYSDALRDELRDVDTYRLFDEAFAASAAGNDAGRAIDADVHTYLPGDLLPKVDITTMANSLEARSPFLDHHLLEWAAGLPTRMKVRPGSTKRILKQAMAQWLPPEVVNRPKMGFGVPMAAWLRGELRDYAHDLLTDHTANGRGFFRPAAVSALLREHDSGIDRSKELWALLQFEQWHRTYLDAPATSTADAWS